MKTLALKLNPSPYPVQEKNNPPQLSNVIYPFSWRILERFGVMIQISNDDLPGFPVPSQIK